MPHNITNWGMRQQYVQKNEPIIPSTVSISLFYSSPNSTPAASPESLHHLNHLSSHTQQTKRHRISYEKDNTALTARHLTIDKGLRTRFLHLPFLWSDRVEKHDRDSNGDPAAMPKR